MTIRDPSAPVSRKNWVRWFDPRGRSIGSWAFIFNRLTGLALAAYLPIHFFIISSLYRGADAWDGLMAFFRSPFALLFDVGLVLALLYHGLNGTRIVLLAFDIGETHQRAMFYTAMAVGAVLLLYAALRLFGV
ncbi:MAG: succinate dehydrogenase, cytochrome b556 subunit [Anaerolineae bacterium]